MGTEAKWRTHTHFFSHHICKFLQTRDLAWGYFGFETQNPDSKGVASKFFGNNGLPARFGGVRVGDTWLSPGACFHCGQLRFLSKGYASQEMNFSLWKSVENISEFSGV
jgi:hypothetical protein